MIEEMRKRFMDANVKEANKIQIEKVIKNL